MSKSLLKVPAEWISQLCEQRAGPRKREQVVPHLVRLAQILHREALFAYLAGLAAAYLIFGGSMHAPEFLAGTVVLLLIVNIRNAWDLMLSMARRRGEADARGQAREADITPGG